jgi:hypothetical protein
MNTYKVKLEVTAEVEAFDESDALEYANDIFGVDDEIKNVKVISVKEKLHGQRSIQTNVRNAISSPSCY